MTKKDIVELLEKNGIIDRVCETFYNEDGGEPLNSDEISQITEVFSLLLELQNNNITQEEFDEYLSEPFYEDTDEELLDSYYDY